MSTAGVLVEWLKNNLGLLSTLEESEKLVKQVPSENNIMFVPAFSGLYAPYWRQDAKR